MILAFSEFILLIKTFINSKRDPLIHMGNGNVSDVETSETGKVTSAVWVDTCSPLTEKQLDRLNKSDYILYLKLTAIGAQREYSQDLKS